MKINGREPTGPNRDFVIIPRGGQAEDYVFWVQALATMEDFDKYCPAPVPPERLTPERKRIVDFEDKDYLEQLSLYSQRKAMYIVLKSLDLPENGLEWDGIDLTKPRTWLNFEEELRKAHFTNREIDKIVEAAFAVNGLSEAKMKEAREAFVRRLAMEATNIVGQVDVPASIKSGNPVSGGE